MIAVRKGMPPVRPEEDKVIFRQPPPAMAAAAAAAVALGLRKKGAGVRTWLLLDDTGKSQVLEAGKHAIMRRTGLPARDLRILDPLLSYPSTVLGRERAIVINLEHIKAIITATEVLILNFKDPSVTPFVLELQKRALRHHHDSSTMLNGRVSVDNVEWENQSDMEDQQAGKSPQLNDYFNQHPNQCEREHAVDMRGTFENQDALKALPFEFVALEACLEAACRCLENEAKTLEQEAHPALDKLTSKISTLNLERVRQIKSRLVAMTGRVQKVRDELEHLLDDDEDMAEMYLTNKVTLQHQIETSPVSSLLNNRDVAEEDDEEEVVEEDGGADQSDVGGGHSRDHFYATPTAAISRGCNHGTHTSTSRSAVSKHLEVEELEMLLEAYFVQIDGTLNKLSTLREYVDDTEDYINIMLDDKQNHLLQMGVMLTTATLVISGFVVVAGVFGMNIKIDMFDDETSTGMKKFLWTVGGGTTGSIFLYVAAIAWCKHKNLLE